MCHTNPSALVFINTEITQGPWFDRARYTLKTAQVKPLLCLGRMQTMKTPVYNSVWLAWTACVFIYVLYVFIFGWLVINKCGMHRCNLRTEGHVISCGSVCERTHTYMREYIHVCACMCTCVWPCGWQWRRARADWYVNISEHTLVYKHPHTFVYTN